MSGNPFDTLMAISVGFTVPRTLQVIAELGIADALDETPRAAAELAAATGTDAEALHRALRALAAHGVFHVESGRFGHTPASRLLRTDHPQSREFAALLSQAGFRLDRLIDAGTHTFILEASLV